MEFRIMTPILLGLVALVMFVVVEWRVRQRGARVAIASLSLLLVAVAVWDFKNLEKQWEQHFLLHSSGQTLLGIEEMLGRQEEAKVLSILKQHAADGALYHPNRTQLEEIRRQISRD